MRLESGYENRRARIEMLPLIDIVFLLLVFFIYAMLSMVAHRGMKVERYLASDLTAEAEMGHIELSRSADLIVVAPATADLMAKMAALAFNVS